MSEVGWIPLQCWLRWKLSFNKRGKQNIETGHHHQLDLKALKTALEHLMTMAKIMVLIWVDST